MQIQIIATTTEKVNIIMSAILWLFYIFLHIFYIFYIFSCIYAFSNIP